MRRVPWILAASVLLIASFGTSQEPRPGPKINGPAVAAVQQEVRLPVEGLSAPQIDAGLQAVVVWANKIQVLVDGPSGATPLVEPDVVLGFGPQAVKLRLVFTADRPGVYVVIVLDGSSGQLATKRLTVGPPVPPPDPRPNPSPDPLPVPGKRVVLLVRETSQVSPQGNLTELALRDGPAADYLASKGHRLWILSDDQPLPTTASAAMQSAFAKAKAAKLPALAIFDPSVADSSAVYVSSIDANASAEAILAILKEHGG